MYTFVSTAGTLRYGPSKPMTSQISPSFVTAAQSSDATASVHSTFFSLRVCEVRRCSVPSSSNIVRMTSEYNYNIYLDSKDRSRREVGPNERVVELQKPLGIVLEEGPDGMVFVASIDPNGNAAASSDSISEGDIVVAVSATFGDEVWSTRGVGLDRVMKSIRVRSGEFVTLVLETPDELFARKQSSTEEAESRRKVARDTRGERPILNPVTWTAAGKPTSSPWTDNAIYEYGDPPQAEVDEKLKQKLKNEMAAPYEQNWILWISGGIFVLVIISVIAGLQ